MDIRFADAQRDAEALLAVYAPYIATSVTFETALPTAEEFAGRIRGIQAAYPYLVLTDGDVAAGYAYAHRARDRAAYDWFAELSVYLRQAYTGRGLGKKLYALLMDLLALQNVQTAMGCVTAPNAASEALHASLGFRRVGVSRRAGYKDGAWHDVIWFERALGPYHVPPAPLLPFPEVDPEAVAAVLARYRW